MTVNSETSRITYAGDGTTVAFSYPYHFDAVGDLVVVLVTTATGAEAVQTRVTDYAVSDPAEAGGTITMTTAPTASESLLIYRDPEILQPTDYAPNDPFPAASHEGALDRLTMIAQRERELGGQAIRVPESEGSAARLPSLNDRKGKYAFFNAATGAVEGATDAGVTLLEGAVMVDTRTAATLLSTDANVILTGGFAALGDGGHGMYTYVASEPSHELKFQTANSRWFELTVDQHGVNVKQAGAKGDGTTDDSTAIANAWAFAIADYRSQTTWTGGTTLLFPPGDFLITSNNVFGDPGYTGQFYWPTIKGAGKGYTVLRFRPTTGNSKHGDDKYYMFDGGDGTTTNTFTPLRVHVEDLVFIPESTNLTTGDEIWFWRQDGTSAQQNFRATNVETRGPRTIAAGAVRSGFLDISGAVNGSENYFVTCNFLYLSHILRNANPQAVDNAFIECDAWVIHDHFFVCDNGALEVRIWGGSWIWADTADVNPQHLFSVDSSGSANPGVGNFKASVFGMKPEMRNAGASLVSAEDGGGGVFVSFVECNFAGGGITGGRDVVSVSQNKHVLFNGCMIPAAFEFNFVAADGLLGALHWGVKSMGVVQLTNCGVTDHISANITKAGIGGRVIADHCFELTGTVAAESGPVDFDSNPFNGGPNEPLPQVRTAVGMPRGQSWASDETYTVVLPVGAMIQRVRCYRPASGGATSRTMTLADGDGTLDTATANENAGLEIDFTPSTVAALTTPRETTNARTITLTAGTLTSAVTGGIFLVDYI